MSQALLSKGIAGHGVKFQVNVASAPSYFFALVFSGTPGLHICLAAVTIGAVLFAALQVKDDGGGAASASILKRMKTSIKRTATQIVGGGSAQASLEKLRELLTQIDAEMLRLTQALQAREGAVGSGGSTFRAPFFLFRHCLGSPFQILGGKGPLRI